MVYRDSDEGELYDLDADPDQYTNLWDASDAATLKSKLLLKLARTTMAREGRIRPRQSFA